MKKNKQTFYLYVTLSLLLLGCTKETTTSTNAVSNATTQNTIASDEVTVNNEFDQAIDEVTRYLSNPNTTILNAYFYSVSPNTYEITYAGNESDGTKSRTADDSIHLNTASWATAGATANIVFGDINFEAYEVTFINSNSTLVLTGNATITNVYGGVLQNLTPTDSIVVKIRAAINFTYNDANIPGITLYTWYFSQVRVFRLGTNDTIVTTRGDTSLNGYSNIGTWGTTRLGNAFYTATTTPMVQNISNAFLSYNPLSGSKSIEGISEPIFVIYGVNTQGSVVASGTPYGFYSSWTNEGTTFTSVLPYYY